ncbi:MAG: hypothetical protein HOE19_03075 [Candidatus Komeilibacteria bacterium]|jgi:hypothetical protein|nr:hypothetical protein [Candidatus Komeilibacteria bacterium]MBT4447659.1 hypothetical protein [Candidatus Komeilibacteria bacterium]
MQQIADIFKNKKKEGKKAPAYQWQDLALGIIDELAIPQSKRNSVFKICKDHDKNFVEKCLDDTKELAQGSGRWRYFFKLVAEYKKSSS